ncbi:hypothetical protein GCM10010873_17950 [Cypionkella aquatica]|uniref:Uncharacterized protein n=1 Tax=Cypionkella aquatica TaxID=1756042 RepID=A0AA37U157_9RHOB|nr:hypothetical protein [Cypionkella aquatica]GLS86821.1 hypothetical protein GCM10010873_17950 [Cypionkella aquatica]
MRVNSMKAECFKMLDDRPQTKSATLMIEVGVKKGTADCYRTYHKALRKAREQEKEAQTEKAQH